VYGKYTLIQKQHKTVYAYTRTLDEEKMFVLLNFSEAKSSIHMLGLSKNSNVLINNYNRLTIAKNSVELAPYQAVIIKL
jgi:oligo-1,6-glucosidase